MTLKELLETTSWEEVATRLATSYPSQKESLPGYKRVYAVLLEKEPAASNMIITLEHVADADEKGGSYESVFGKIEGAGQPFCLSITPWSEWLGMSIEPETIRKYTPEEIAAHCLYEMTFHGFTEEKRTSEKVVRPHRRSTGTGFLDLLWTRVEKKALEVYESRNGHLITRSQRFNKMKKDTIKVAYNANEAGFILSKATIARMKELGYPGKFSSAGAIRHHPALIQCIEELGRAACGSLKPSGPVSDLRIATVDSPRYYVIDYGGKERVIGMEDLTDASAKSKGGLFLESFPAEKVFFTADTHFGNHSIIHFSSRPFKSAEEMDAELIHRWNETVPEDGIVFHLGDFAQVKMKIENQINF